MFNNIIIYTSPTCPKCKILKKKLDNLNIPYTEESENLFKIEELGFLELPIMQIGDNFFNFREALGVINNEN